MDEVSARIGGREEEIGANLLCQALSGFDLDILQVADKSAELATVVLDSRKVMGTSGSIVSILRRTVSLKNDRSPFGGGDPSR